MRQEKLWKKFESHCLNEGLSNKRINKLKSIFLTLERGLKGDFSTITRKQMEDFIDKLHRDEFKKINGENISGSTKADIKKVIRQFWKWLKGDNEFYPNEVSWIKARIRKDEQPKDKPIISHQEILKLASHFKDIDLKVMTLLLFDSGFRIDEMLTLRKCDITWEDYDEKEMCFWIHCNSSKTEKRKVPVPLFTEDLQALFNSASFKSKKRDDLAFNTDYDKYRLALRYASFKTFKKHITAHCLRHSSATYYAQLYEGNMNLLAERYGWSYSSQQLKTYIRRSGAYQRAGAKKVFTNETLRLTKENKELLQRIEELEKDKKTTLETLKEFNHKISKISKHLKLINGTPILHK